MFITILGSRLLFPCCQHLYDSFMYEYPFLTATCDDDLHMDDSFPGGSLRLVVCSLDTRCDTEGELGIHAVIYLGGALSNLSNLMFLAPAVQCPLYFLHYFHHLLKGSLSSALRVRLFRNPCSRNFREWFAGVISLFQPYS